MKKGDKVERLDGGHTVGNKGTVLEVDEIKQRARVNWENLGRNLKTWVKFMSLKKIG